MIQAMLLLIIRAVNFKREHDPTDHEDPAPLAAYCVPPQAVHSPRRRKHLVKPTFLSCAPCKWRKNP